MKMDFEGNEFLATYLMTFIQLYDSEFEDLEGLYITPQDYQGGYSIFPIALAAGGHDPPNGILRLKIEYKLPLTYPVVVLVFAEYEKTLEMDKTGKIHII